MTETKLSAVELHAMRHELVNPQVKISGRWVSVLSTHRYSSKTIRVRTNEHDLSLPFSYPLIVRFD